MAVNDYKLFAGANGANVVTQVTYAALPELATGFQSGLAKSANINKVLRQSSAIAAMIGQFIADRALLNASDDGNIAVLEANFITALQNLFRVKVPQPFNLYVNPTTGNDTNPGNTAGAAFRTIQAAVNSLYTKYDLNGGAVTINLAGGTYTAASGQILLTLGNSPPGAPSSGPTINLVGNPATPSSVILSAVNANCVQVSGGSSLNVSGMRFTATGPAGAISSITGCGLTAVAGGTIIVNGPVDFGACQNMQVRSAANSLVQFSSGYTISAGAGAHWYCDNSSVILGAAAATVAGSPAFSTAFAVAVLGGIISMAGMTFSGTATGQRYSVNTNGVISGTVGNVNFFPGSVAGASATGGQYV